ncbi:MFS transporter [Rhodococcus wratislaviensis]|uniref:Putative proline/betaine transporter n=1 Tax=Rhodococcus wratislaviensis NBRC 100605 TaxID=1219028 RepID=X0QX22_RHOWR|nr:MFS transporter [Rhodococcus wratislaviensis]GAF43150.1 putative major facilitator superfamily transporter [Rhodococcus wratislaviensis NBRC 100605]
MTSTQISVTPQAPVRPLKVAGASLIGTAIEWYDYFIYGMAAAIVFGPLFFPSFSSIAGTLAAFATFSVGFIARPIGGVVMGHFGDRIGRKSMLVLSLMLMGGATVGIGLLPTYATIGVWAPILLVTLRFVQGIGVGGEWGGAVLMAVEHAPANRKGFYGSFPQMGVPGGLILANLVFLGVSTSLSEEAFLSWGWRVPFLASAVMVLMGLVIRFTITESPDFEKVKSTHRDQRLPIVTVLRENLREVLLAAGAFIGINTVGYIFMAYLLSYSTKVLGMSKTLVLVFTLVASFVWLIVIPVASMLSDRYGRRRLLVTGSVGLTVWAAALFPLIDLGNPAVMMLALLGTAVFMGIVYGPIAALFTELFSAEVRYSGASLGYQIGSVLGGGLAPTVAAALYANWGSSAPISLYLTAVTLLSLLCVIAITRKVRAAE